MENVIKKCDVPSGLLRLFAPRVQREKATMAQVHSESTARPTTKFNNSHFIANSYGDTLSKYRSEVLKVLPGFTSSALEKDILDTQVDGAKKGKPKSGGYKKRFKKERLPVKLRVNGIDVLGGKILFNPYRGPKYGDTIGLEHWTSNSLVKNYMAAEHNPVEKHRETKISITLPRPRAPAYFSKVDKKKSQPFGGRYTKKNSIWDLVVLKQTKKEQEKGKKGLLGDAKQPTPDKQTGKKKGKEEHLGDPKQPTLNKQTEKKKGKNELLGDPKVLTPNKQTGKKKGKKKKVKEKKVEPGRKLRVTTSKRALLRSKEHRRLSDEHLYSEIGKFRSRRLTETSVATSFRSLGSGEGWKSWANGLWPALVNQWIKAKDALSEKWTKKD